MVDVVDGVAEHSGVNPVSSTGDGGTAVSLEEFKCGVGHIENLHDDRGRKHV